MSRLPSLTGVIKAAKAWDAAALRTMLKIEPAFATVKDKTGRTPLHYVATVELGERDAKASIAAAKVLVNAGADINAIHKIKDDDEIFRATPVWTAYSRGQNLPLLRWLLKQGADPNNTLWSCAWFDDDTTAKLLLKHGAKIDPVFHGLTPFFEAVGWRRFKFAGATAKAGANVNFRSPKKETVLHLALRHGFKVSEFEQILKFGTNPKLKNANGETAVQMATRLRKAGALKLMT